MASGHRQVGNKSIKPWVLIVGLSLWIAAVVFAPKIPVLQRLADWVWQNVIDPTSPIKLSKEVFQNLAASFIAAIFSLLLVAPLTARRVALENARKWEPVRSRASNEFGLSMTSLFHIFPNIADERNGGRHHLKEREEFLRELGKRHARMEATYLKWGQVWTAETHSAIASILDALEIFDQQEMNRAADAVAAISSYHQRYQDKEFDLDKLKELLSNEHVRIGGRFDMERLESAVAGLQVLWSTREKHWFAYLMNAALHAHPYLGRFINEFIHESRHIQKIIIDEIENPKEEPIDELNELNPAAAPRGKDPTPADPKEESSSVDPH